MNESTLLLPENQQRQAAMEAQRGRFSWASAQLLCGFTRPVTPEQMHRAVRALHAAANYLNDEYFPQASYPIGVNTVSAGRQFLLNLHRRFSRAVDDALRLSPAQFELLAVAFDQLRSGSGTFTQGHLLHAVSVVIQLRPGPHPASPSSFGRDEEAAALRLFGGGNAVLAPGQPVTVIEASDHEVDWVVSRPELQYTSDGMRYLVDAGRERGWGEADRESLAALPARSRTIGDALVNPLAGYDTSKHDGHEWAQRAAQIEAVRFVIENAPALPRNACTPYPVLHRTLGDQAVWAGREVSLLQLDLVLRNVQIAGHSVEEALADVAQRPGNALSDALAPQFGQEAWMGELTRAERSAFLHSTKALQPAWFPHATAGLGAVPHPPQTTLSRGVGRV